MEAILASSVTKIITRVCLAKASGAVSGSVLAGLSSVSAAPSSAALGSAMSTMGSLLGTLDVSYLLQTLDVSYLLESPAEALTASPISGNWPWASHTPSAKAAVAVIGGVVAVGSVPVVLGAMGFTGTGIAASSVAAKMMSAAAIANGGGVAAGSLVATLQSVGAAGLSLSSKVVLGSAGSALASLMV